MYKTIILELLSTRNVTEKEYYHSIKIFGHAGNITTLGDDIIISERDEDISGELLEKTSERQAYFFVDEIDELIDALQLAKKYVNENRGE